jgi:lipopolysaccharide transport system ATP-binding protein
MRKGEIDRKLDEIIEFSEIGRFLDTPVKRYSSGMGVRLGFAVAAHLEPEILIVDEVLAVGDLSFQRKCLAKMESVAGEGRTVIFVSHAMPSIQALCQRVILLEGGRITLEGAPTEIVNHYEDMQTVAGAGRVELADHPNRITQTRFFQSLTLRNVDGKEADRFRLGEKISIELELDLDTLQMSDPFIVIHIQRHNQTICYLTTHYMHKDLVKVRGRFLVRCVWDPGYLAPGNYLIQAISLKHRSGGERLDKIQNVTSFEIFPTDVYGTGKGTFSDGLILPLGEWQFEARDQPPLPAFVSAAPQKELQASVVSAE